VAWMSDSPSSVTTAASQIRRRMRSGWLRRHAG
jgi:hypothetical protein